MPRKSAKGAEDGGSRIPKKSERIEKSEKVEDAKGIGQPAGGRAKSKGKNGLHELHITDGDAFTAKHNLRGKL